MGNRKNSSRLTPSRQRAHLHAQGLRPIEIWVPDVTSPTFRRAARAQSRLVAGSPGEAADQALIDAISVDAPA